LTIIVAIEHKNGVQIACDSQVSGFSSFIMHPSQQKFSEVGEYIIGAAGRLRTAQVIFNANDLPEPPENPTDDELNRFMMTDFTMAAQRAARIAGIEQVQDRERLLTEAELVVCTRGRAYVVGDDYSVMRAGDASKIAKGVAVTGSGYRFALGAYYTLAKYGKVKDPIEIATTMVEAAINWDQGCGGDIYYYDQRR
jgi:ATP-dependent protease HslVU (ClpYQ) peptidase subunit